MACEAAVVYTEIEIPAQRMKVNVSNGHEYAGITASASAVVSLPSKLLQTICNEWQFMRDQCFPKLCKMVTSFE